MILNYLAGPAIGAIIGYCTNFVAVKMLFLPRKEIRIAGHKLPFTPGAIPKGKKRLAKAIGQIIEEKLITEEDIINQIVTKDTQDKITDKIIENLSKEIKDLLLQVIKDENQYDQIKERISDNVSNQIIDSVSDIGIGNVIAREAKEAVSKKAQGTMLQMFLSDELIDSILGPIGDQIESYICKNGSTYIKPVVEKKIDNIEKKSVVELLNEVDIDEEMIRQMLNSTCHDMLSSAVSQMVNNLKIGQMVEEKVNAMDVRQVEDMLLKVMKKELNTIVNLGALIGMIIGILNIWI